MPILDFGDKSPKIDPTAFISPQATVIGNVEIGPKANIWPGVVIRGDNAPVRIGEATCVQDSVIIHAHTEKNPAIIGNKVILGTASAVHGVYIGDFVSAGEGSVIFDGATLGEGVILAPGSIVPTNVVIPPRSLNSGAPAAQIREVAREEIEKHQARADTIADVFQKLKAWQTTG